MDFYNYLVQWYLNNKRDLPWRKTKNPYNIWLSEIILQQTRVEQGLSYYLKFINTYPTVKSLANASEEEVLKLWQGLGYYSRARNLHQSAKHISFNLNNKFPTTFKGLLDLKGVGDYTASAIASICYNLPYAVVDGNVYRVLSRYFGIETPINSSEGIKQFKNLAQQLIITSKPGTYNQAIMDFGALHCKPKNPKCEACGLQHKCIAYQTNTVGKLPFKKGKTKVTKRYFNYLVPIDANGLTVLHKRENGIWKNLYQFPLIETTKGVSKKNIIEDEVFKELIKNQNFNLKLYNNNFIVHKLSHQHIFTKFWLLKVDTILSESILWSDVEKFPVPKLIDNFLRDYKSR